MPKPTISNRSINGDLRYLKLLARDFPTISQVTTEIINLEAILQLPFELELNDGDSLVHLGYEFAGFFVRAS